MDELKPERFAMAFVDLFEWAQSQSEGGEDDGGLGSRLREHLGGDATGLPVVSRALAG